MYTSGERHKTGTLLGVARGTLEGIGIEVPGGPSNKWYSFLYTIAYIISDSLIS